MCSGVQVHNCVWCCACRPRVWRPSGTGRAMVRLSSTRSSGASPCRVSAAPPACPPHGGAETTAFSRSSPSLCWTGLSQDLEELMVEGLLLQVSLPEVQRLHQVLLCRTSTEQHTDGCASPPQEAEFADCDLQYNSQGNNPNQVHSQIYSWKGCRCHPRVSVFLLLCDVHWLISTLIFLGWHQWKCGQLREERKEAPGEGRFSQKALSQKTEDEQKETSVQGSFHLVLSSLWFLSVRWLRRRNGSLSGREVSASWGRWGEIIISLSHHFFFF